MEFNAHIFETEQEALDALQLINDGEGIPKHPNSKTITYTDIQPYNGIWFIRMDEVTEKYINHFEKIEIIIEE
jgi:hypothetical protein